MPYAILTVILVALDQLVKYLVLQNIPLGEHVPFIPYILDLTYVKNTGAAFSMFSEHTWMLTLISAVMSVVLAVAIWKNFFRHPLGKLCLTLILGGAIGNLIDRIRARAVTDFLDVYVGQLHWPAFNVADIAICLGVGATALVLLREIREESRQKGE